MDYDINIVFLNILTFTKDISEDIINDLQVEENS